MSAMYQDKMREARKQLVIRYPFWSSIALGLFMEESKQVPTMATDGKHIWYSEEWLEKLTLEETLGVIAHESAHVGLLHPFRTKDHHDRAKANLAQDMVINIILKDDGLVLPGKPLTFEQMFAGETGYLYDPKWKGKSWEEVYSQMPKMPQNPTKCPVHQGEPKPGSGEQQDGQGQPKDGEGTQKCTCKGGGKNLSSRDVIINDSVGDETEAKIRVQQAVEVARQKGKLPAGMKELVEDLLEVKVDWKDILRNKLKSRARDDYDPRRHNRRLAQQDIYFPSLYSEKMGEIHVAIDTSGSTMGDRRKFLTEMIAIAEEVRPSKLTVSFCDAKVWDVREFGPSEYDMLREAKMEFPGGGGTSFIPPFEWIQKNGREPEVMIYFTDMEGSFPEQAPSWDTIWLSTTEHDTAPFGEVIRYDETA